MNTENEPANENTPNENTPNENTSGGNFSDKNASGGNASGNERKEAQTTNAASAQTPILSAEQSFMYSLNEVSRNLGTRRLMFAIVNVILPGILLGLGDMLTGSDYSASFLWLPRHSIVITAFFLVLSTLFISGILMRCHFGLVVNGTRMHKIRTGELVLQKLNLRGITTNFVVINGFTAGAAAALIAYVAGLGWFSLIVGAIFIVVFPLLLSINHKRANKLCESLDESWHKSEITNELEEKHLDVSLKATNEDISVIAAMSAAVFIGFFSALSHLVAIPEVVNVGGVQKTFVLDIPVVELKSSGALWLSGFITILILFSAQMIARLRLAVARFSKSLAEIKGEKDDPYKFKYVEKTFLLYLTTVLMAAFSLVIFLWAVASAGVAVVGAVLLFVLAIVYYIVNLKHPIKL